MMKLCTSGANAKSVWPRNKRIEKTTAEVLMPIYSTIGPEKKQRTTFGML